MAAVITYWQLAEDENDLLQYLDSLGEVVGLPDHWVETKDELLPVPLSLFVAEHNPKQCLFGLKTQAQEATIEQQEQNGETFFTVQCMKSCLIGYRRGRIRDGRLLTPTTLCAYWNFPSEDRTTMLEKDPEFVRWAKKVLNWVRRNAPKQIEFNGRQCRATKRVTKAVRNSGLELAAY